MTFGRPHAGLALGIVSLLSFGASVDGQTSVSPKAAFDVVSVRINESTERPRVRVSAVRQTGRLTLTSMTVQELIQSAYILHPFELIGNGSAVLKQRVDVVAKAAGPTTVAEMQQMLQPMLDSDSRWRSIARCARWMRCSWSAQPNDSVPRSGSRRSTVAALARPRRSR
jgi:hypothetical protein